jgi:hypothetical protein
MIIPFFSFLYAIIAPIYIFIKRNLVFNPLLLEYKTIVIPKMLQFINEGLHYEPRNGMPQEEFNKSGLFERPTHYASEDLVSGQAGKFTVKFADVNASRRSSRKGRNSGSSIENVFIGLYGYTQLYKTFQAPIYIKPTYTGIAMADSVLNSLMSLSLVKQLKDQVTAGIIKTGNAEFDGYFLVRSQQEAEVKRVINSIFIQMLVAFKKQVEVPVHIGLIQNELHFGFSGVNLFEVNAHTSLTEKNVTLKYFTYLQLALGLAEAMDALPMEPAVVR